MLYELLTGERPFKGGAVTLMRKQVLEDAPPLPPALLESVGASYDAVIQRLMKKSAQERFSSASELLQALAELEEAPGFVAGMTQPTARISSTREGKASSASFASLHSLAGSESSEVTAPRKKPHYGVALLAVVTFGVGGLYWLGLSPRTLFLDLLAGKQPSALPLPAVSPAQIASASAAPIPTESTVDTAAPLTSDIASGASAAPVDSAAPAESGDEATVAPDDSATTASTAPRHSGPHVTQPRPASKPIHKKSYTAPKHNGPSIPPFKQWFN
jgi:serine/threonine protein kinase